MLFKLSDLPVGPGLYLIDRFSRIASLVLFQGFQLFQVLGEDTFSAEKRYFDVFEIFNIRDQGYFAFDSSFSVLIFKLTLCVITALLSSLPSRIRQDR